MCFLRGVFVSIGLPPLDVVVGLPLGCDVAMGSPPLDVVVGRPPCGLGSVGSILLRFEGQCGHQGGLPCCDVEAVQPFLSPGFQGLLDR